MKNLLGAKKKRGARGRETRDGKRRPDWPPDPGSKPSQIKTHKGCELYLNLLKFKIVYNALIFSFTILIETTKVKTFVVSSTY